MRTIEDFERFVELVTRGLLHGTGDTKTPLAIQWEHGHYEYDDLIYVMGFLMVVRHGAPRYEVLVATSSAPSKSSSFSALSSETALLSSPSCVYASKNCSASSNLVDLEVKKST